MNRPHDPEARLAAWLEQGPTSGPDDGLSSALARAHSTHQRPRWLVTLRGGTMETTWRARPVFTTRLAFALLITMLVLALAAGAAIVGSRLIQHVTPSRTIGAPGSDRPATDRLPGRDTAQERRHRDHRRERVRMATPATTARPPWLPSPPNDCGTMTTDAQRRSLLQPGRNVDPAHRHGRHHLHVRRSRRRPLSHQPDGLAFDASGNMFVADTGAGRCGSCDPAGNVTPVAGNGTWTVPRATTAPRSRPRSTLSALSWARTETSTSTMPPSGAASIRRESSARSPARGVSGLSATVAPRTGRRSVARISAPWRRCARQRLPGR